MRGGFHLLISLNYLNLNLIFNFHKRLKEKKTKTYLFLWLRLRKPRVDLCENLVLESFVM